MQICRLLGGGVAGHVAGFPPSPLAVLPGTTQLMLVDRAEWLLSLITLVLAAPRPEVK